jgi:hypothetical protein
MLRSSEHSCHCCALAFSIFCIIIFVISLSPIPLRQPSLRVLHVGGNSLQTLRPLRALQSLASLDVSYNLLDSLVVC